VLLEFMVASGVLIAMSGSWVAIAAGFFALGICTAPINAVRLHASGYVIPQNRQVEGFAIIDSANGIGFAFAGFLLAAVPLPGMLAGGAVTGLVVLAAAPLLLRPQERAREGAEEVPASA
jgi:hypothetical protein